MVTKVGETIKNMSPDTPVILFLHLIIHLDKFKDGFPNYLEYLIVSKISFLFFNSTFVSITFVTIC